MQAALDAWSVGVLAFELLTGGQALQPFLGRQEVRRIPAACMPSVAVTLDFDSLTCTCMLLMHAGDGRDRGVEWAAATVGGGQPDCGRAQQARNIPHEHSEASRKGP